MMRERRAKRGTSKALTPGPQLRFLRPPNSFSVTLGLLSWKTLRVTVRQEERGGCRFSHTRDFDLDLEGRLPAEAHAELYRALEDFICAEWTERISRTF